LIFSTCFSEEIPCFRFSSKVSFCLWRNCHLSYDDVLVEDLLFCLILRSFFMSYNRDFQIFYTPQFLYYSILRKSVE
jgi:hypothetical protein